ncbi:MAG: ATP-grasp domain-containing protein [Spirochaetaceae bacterium]|jgi:biotin carboxylase|nr:ATP-grasp domain-containing protein [Spirochaetaceae bacterium]
MDKIIILGAGVMQGPAIRIAGEMGFERHVLDGDAEAAHRGSGEYFHHIDLKDKERILELAVRLKDSSGRLGVMTAGTDFSASVAFVAEKLGLPGHRYEAALNATDKARMRACFQAAGVASPAWMVVDEEALRNGGAVAKPFHGFASGVLHGKTPCLDIRRGRGRGIVDAIGGGAPVEGVAKPLRGFASGVLHGKTPCLDTKQGRSEGGGNASCRDFPPLAGGAGSFDWAFPLVVKPCDNMGGRGCSRVDSLAGLEAALADAVRFSRTGRAIVEEYMDGAEFSVDAIVYEGRLWECGFADRHIFFPPYFVEMGHTMPSNAGAREKDMLMRCFDAGVKALGLTCGAVKGDLKLTRKGPMIGEIAARLSGGFMSGWTYPYSSGFEVTKAAIEIAMGREPDIPRERGDWTSAERAVISIPGTVREVLGVEEAARMTDVEQVFMRVSPGSKVVFPRNNVEKCGNVLSRSRYRRDAIGAAEKAAQAILIRLEPGNPETEAFLAQPPETPYPPSAIQACPNGERRDYAGREAREIMAIVRALTGERMMDNPSLEKALFRGGYQGAVYYMDTRMGTAGHQLDRELLGKLPPA